VKFVFNFLASGFGVSLIPAAILKGKKNTGAGFLGTLVAVPLALLIMPENWLLQIFFLINFTLFAVWVSANATFEGQDNPKIVIDEIAGYFFAIAFLPRTAEMIILAFIFFRIFDWLKPFFIKKFDEMKNAWGVVFDDVAAGILANVILWIYILIMRSI